MTNTEQPLVSIITPAYNAAQFIGATIQSVQAQTYQNWEMIIGDDGSKDSTAEVIRSYAEKDSRVKYVYQENAGQSAARNSALAQAKGKYISLLDADDLFLPTKLEEQVKYLESHPECGLCYCKIYHFYNEKPEELYYFEVDHPSGYLFDQLLRKNFINPMSVMLRKEILDQYGGFESSFRRVDEQYLWLKLSFHKVQFCYLDMPLGKYRVFKGSLSNETTYFKETEEKFLQLLTMIQGWMTPDQQKQYDFEELVKRSKKRLLIGKLMSGKNPFARLLFALYNLRRRGRFQKIT